MSLSRRPGNMRAHHAGVMEARAGRPGGQASRRVRGPTAHRAAGGEPPLASRGMQNSQRVLLAKPRTAPRRGGASREGGEPPRAVTAKHRALPQRDRTTAHGKTLGRWRGMSCTEPRRVIKGVDDSGRFR